MGYPISNLRKDFQDINSDNAEYVARYTTLLRETLYGETDETLLRVPTFDDVSEYYNANKNNLDPVILNAEVLNNLTQYVEDLKNYTIAVKNQIHFADINISPEDFDLLDENIAEGDILIYTRVVDTRKNITSIQKKLADGTYEIIFKMPSMIYYIEVTDANIHSLEDTGETIDYEIIPANGASPTTVSAPSSYNYLGSCAISSDYINDGDVISINCLYAINKEIYFLKFHDKFYFINHGYNGNEQCLFGSYTRKDFIFCVDGLPKLKNKITGGYSNGILTYDDEGNILDRNQSVFLEKKESDTDWIDLDYDSDDLSVYYPNSPSTTVNTAPQVRRIGNTVHMRGVLKIKATGTRKYIKLTLPSEIFYPTKKETFVQHTGYLEGDYFDSDCKLLCVRIGTNGTVLITPFVAEGYDGIMSTGTTINCNATWFVD